MSKKIKIPVGRGQYAEVSPERVLANDVVLVGEPNPNARRLWVCLNEYGPMGAVWADNEEVALDVLVDTDLAKGPWASYWADRQEERGRSLSGVDVYEACPPSPAWAKRWARELYVQIEAANPLTVPELYARAVQEGFNKNEETFGFYLACQATGMGIAWDDDLRKPDLKISLPYKEFYR